MAAAAVNIHPPAGRDFHLEPGANGRRFTWAYYEFIAILVGTLQYLMLGHGEAANVYCMQIKARASVRGVCRKLRIRVNTDECELDPWRRRQPRPVGRHQWHGLAHVFTLDRRVVGQSD